MPLSTHPQVLVHLPFPRPSQVSTERSERDSQEWNLCLRFLLPHLIGEEKDSHRFVCLVSQHPRRTKAASSAAVLRGDVGWRDTSEAVGVSKHQLALPTARGVQVQVGAADVGLLEGQTQLRAVLRL